MDRLEGLRTTEDDRGDPLAQCGSCHRWMPAEEYPEHQYYCSGRADADEEQSSADERPDVE